MTSVRFFAAMGVVAYHAQLFKSGVPGLIVGVGHVAVPFFFMISGFILGLVYLSQDRPVNARRFWISRFARLYPLYIVCLVVDLPHYLHTRALGLQGSSHSVASVLASCLVLVQSWTGNPPGLNGPAWSLSVESFFYLLFPFLGPFLWRIRFGWLLPASIAVFLAGLVPLAWANDAYVVTFNPLRHLPTFVQGILLSKFAWHCLTNERARNVLARWSMPLMLFAMLAITGASFLKRYPGLLQHGLLTPAFAAVLLACTAQNGWVHRTLSHPGLVLLGHASYAIYLIHGPIKTICRPLLEQHPLVAIPLYLVGVVWLSIVSFRHFEMPARKSLLSRAGLSLSSVAFAEH